MNTALADSSRILIELARKACGAGKTAEEWLIELAESEARPPAEMARHVAMSGLQKAGQVVQLAGQAAHLVGQRVAGVPVLAQRAESWMESRAGYLRSIARRIAAGGHASGEVELASLLRALLTWTKLRKEQMMALVIRLSQVTGEHLKEFVFRLSRAAMAVCHLTAQELLKVLVMVGQVVLVVTAVVVVMVMLAVITMLLAPLGAAMLVVTAVCAIGAAVAVIVKNLAELLAACGFSSASATMASWFGDNGWFGVMLDVIIAFSGSVMAVDSAIWQCLVQVALCAGGALSDIAGGLARGAISADVIGNLLVAAWVALRSSCREDLKALIRVLKTTLGWTLEQVGTALVAARLSADDLWDGLTAVFGATKSQMAAILKSAGADAGAIADKLKNKASASEDEVAQALKDAQFGATEVARAIKDKFGKGLVGVAKALKHAGWAMSDVVGALATVFGMARSAVETALRIAGLM